MHAHSVDQVKEEQGDHPEEGDDEIGVHVPQVGHDGCADIRQGRNFGEDLLVSQAVDDCTSEETKQTRDDVI